MMFPRIAMRVDRQDGRLRQREGQELAIREELIVRAVLMKAAVQSRLFKVHQESAKGERSPSRLKSEPEL